MRTPLCAVLLVHLAGAAFAYSTCEEDIQQELERERKEDSDAHGCRACGKIDLEAAPNCPAKGYDCDESLQVTSSVISVGSCECAQLRCAADNATLAVDGELVKKVSCKDHKWTSTSGEAESAVCARECGVNICQGFPAVPAAMEELLTILPVRPPDDEHRCAWADCENGAVFADVEGGGGIYKGTSSFACTGNRMWKYAGPREEKRNLIAAYCIKYGCEKLPYEESSSLCGKKYECYEPTFVELDESNGVWGQMTCTGEPNALRFTENDTMVGQATCALGHWQVTAVGPIAPQSEVMCVNCIGIKKDPADDQKPDDSDIKAGVTCPDGYQLTIEYGDSKTQTKVDSMNCLPDSTWITTGEEFVGYSSLDDLITQGVPWTVRCLPKECKTLLFGQSNDVCTSKKYDCEAASYEVDAGTGSMRCVDEGALRLDTENTPIDAQCTSGVWKNGETTIPGTSAVRCINCPVPDLVEDGQNGKPKVSARNKEVSCEPGKGTLTIEIVAGGTPTDYPVSRLTCSPEFEWVAAGSLGTYTSLADAVSRGATWKAKCVTPVVKPCATLPPSLTEPYCSTDHQTGADPLHSDNRKYLCQDTIKFVTNGDNSEGGMQCPTGDLRYAADDKKVIKPTCLNGQWRDNQLNIPDDTKISCISCRTVNSKFEDAEQYTTGLSLSCPSKPMVFEFRNRDTFAVTHRSKLKSFTCNTNTMMWEAEGEPLLTYNSFEEVLEAGEVWLVRCINDGEP